MIKINTGLDNFLDAAGKTLDVAPQLYDDTIQPAAKETGKTLGLIPRTINAALAPLRQWIAHREYNVAETEKLLAYKLEHIDPEKIVQPEAYVAVPAIQAISYSMDNDDLRNLYANLIAKSMNVDTKDSVHPSFVEIIKQLSPLDAILFKTISISSINPMININLTFKNKSGMVALVKNITLINIASEKDISISIDNLVRLKLIDVPFDAYYSDENIYKPFYNLVTYKSYEAEYDTSTEYDLSMDKKIIAVTDMGKSFYDVCVKDI